MVKNLQIIESETSQMPFTQIEKERFSYFFKDQLTNIYNATYLWRVINDLIPGMHYNYFLMIELRGMTDYNSHFGWNKGNEIIQELAQVLIKITKEEQLFRVFGDDFIICFETLDAKDSFLAAWKITQIQGVLCNCRSIEKNMFIEIL